jgi:putative transposase
LTASANRCIGRRRGLAHHRDRGVQYVSIRGTQRLAEAGIELSVDSVGDSCNNALTETINGLYEIQRRSWKTLQATLDWVDRFNRK